MFAYGYWYPSQLTRNNAAGFGVSGAWTGSAGCATPYSTTHVLKFTNTVYFTSGIAGITFSKAGFYAEAGVAPASVVEASGAGNTLTFTVNWANPVEAGDVVSFAYDSGVGDYNDGDTPAKYMDSITRNLINCFGDGLLTLDGTETFAVDFTKGLTPIVDQGDGYVFDADDGDHTHTDFEGIVRQINAEECRAQGSRRVENLIAAPENLNAAPWETTGAATIISATEFTSTGASNDGVAYYLTQAFVAGDQLRLRVKISADVDLPANAVQISFAGTGATSQHTTVTPTTSLQIFTTDVFTWDAVPTNPYIRIRHLSGVDPNARTITVTEIQVENVTGQSNQNPGEYVSVGVGTEPESLADPGFDDETKWTLGNYWSMSGSQLIFTTSSLGRSAYAGSSELTDAIPIKQGKMYAVTVVCSEYNTGGSIGTTCYVSDWLESNTLDITGVGTFTAVFDSWNHGVAPDGEKGVWVYANTGAAGSTVRIVLDSVSIKEIDHGSNVDGAKYFYTTNGNEVNSNVVTELPGILIAPSVRDGVLIEEQRTNIWLYSSDLSQTGGSTAWQKVYVTVGSGTHSTPIGLNSTCELFETVDAAVHYIYESRNLTTTNNNAVSFMAKANGRNRFTFRESSASGKYITFDLSTGSVVAVNNMTGSITPISGFAGWYYCTVGFSATTTGNKNLTFNTNTDTGVGFESFAGDITKGILLTAVQLEENKAFPTSYIPTSGSAVIRTAETLEYGVENYSDEMTVVAEFNLSQDAAVRKGGTLIEILQSATNAVVVSFSAIGALSLVGLVSGTPVFLAQQPSGFLSAGRHKVGIALSKTTGSCELVINGAGITPTFDGGMPTITPVYMFIGSSQAGTQQLAGAVTNTRFYGRVMTVAELQEATS